MRLYGEIGSIAKNNGKTYNSNKNHNTKNYNTKSIKKINKDLESTTRICVDSLRLNDSETLVTSFLEGRVKSNKKKKERLLSLKKIILNYFSF